MEENSSADDVGTHRSPRFLKRRKMVTAESESEKKSESKEPVPYMWKQNKRPGKKEHQKVRRKHGKYAEDSSESEDVCSKHKKRSKLHCIKSETSSESERF